MRAFGRQGACSFSVVIAVLNEAEGINDLIEGIRFAQRHQGYEIIVVDGDPNGSTARGITDESVTAIVSETGRARQMNAGAAIARGQLTMEPKFTRQAETVLNAFSKGLTQSPAGFTEMLTALDFYLGPRREIVIAGNPDADDTNEMIRLIRQMFMPRTVLLMHQQGSAGTEIEQVAPFLKEQKAIDGKAAAYVCRNFVCNKPVTAAGELKKLLTAAETPGGEIHDKEN